jgi:hypothetical protein
MLWFFFGVCLVMFLLILGHTLFFFKSTGTETSLIWASMLLMSYGLMTISFFSALTYSITGGGGKTFLVALGLFVTSPLWTTGSFNVMSKIYRWMKGME